MVTRPTATGFVGGSEGKKRVSEKKTPVAKQNADAQSSAAVIRSESGRAFMRGRVYQCLHDRIMQRDDGRVRRLHFRREPEPPDGLRGRRPDGEELRPFRDFLPLFGRQL